MSLVTETVGWNKWKIHLMTSIDINKQNHLHQKQREIVEHQKLLYHCQVALRPSGTSNSWKCNDGNGVKCDHCKKVCDFWKQLEIYKEPDVLLLHIKRFQVVITQSSGYSLEKLHTPVDIPLSLMSQSATFDVTPFMSQTASPHQLSTSWPIYTVYGFVCHVGKSISSGHYIAYVYHHANPS